MPGKGLLSPGSLVNSRGECLPGARPAHARRATFVLSSLFLPTEVPQVDCTRLQTFRAKHAA